MKYFSRRGVLIIYLLIRTSLRVKTFSKESIFFVLYYLFTLEYSSCCDYFSMISVFYIWHFYNRLRIGHYLSGKHVKILRNDLYSKEYISLEIMNALSQHRDNMKFVGPFISSFSYDLSFVQCLIVEKELNLF